MATEKSTAVSNSQASPPVTTTVRGLLHSVADTMEVSNGADGDVAILKLNVPVDAKLRSVRLATDDLVGDALASVGFYKANDDGTFTEVDKDLIANDVDVNDAALAMTELRFSIADIATVNSKVWQLAGLSAKPTYADLYVAVTFETDTEAAGTVTLIVDYIV